MNTTLRVALLRPTPPESPDLAPETLALAESLAAMGHAVHLFFVDHRGKALRVAVRGPLTLHAVAPVATGVTRPRALLSLSLAMLRAAARLESAGRLDLADIPTLAPQADPFAVLLPIVTPTLTTLRSPHDREPAGTRAEAYARTLDRLSAGQPHAGAKDLWRHLALSLARFAPPQESGTLAPPSPSLATPELV